MHGCLTKDALFSVSCTPRSVSLYILSYAQLPAPSSSRLYFSLSQLSRSLLYTSLLPLQCFFILTTASLPPNLLAVLVSQNLPSTPVRFASSPPLVLCLPLSRNASIIHIHLWLSPKTEPRFKTKLSGILITHNEQEVHESSLFWVTAIILSCVPSEQLILTSFPCITLYFYPTCPISV